MINNEMNDECHEIITCLNDNIYTDLNGKDCVKWMKKYGKQWRQMEWPGFFFEEYSRQILIKEIGGGEGPSYHRVKFDYQKNFVWDFKMHSIYNSKGQNQQWLILNDLEALSHAIDNWGGAGFIIAEGEMGYEKNGEFRDWHDNYKGGLSPYQLRKKKEGAWHRRRKTSCRIESIMGLFFEAKDIIDEGRKEGWLKGFQEGMINSNDIPRRAKVQINIDTLPPHLISSVSSKFL